MSQYICKICDKKFDENEKQITHDENLCILHSKKDEQYDIQNNPHFIQALLSLLKKTDNKLNDIHFPKDIELSSSILDTNNIIFENCTFNNSNGFKLNNTKLLFTNCIFGSNWNHIKNKKTVVYNECNFEQYSLNSSSKNKEIINNLLFYDCQIKNLHCQNAIFKNQLLKFSDTNKYYNIKEIILTNCVFEKDFEILSLNSLDKKFKIYTLDLTNSVFEKRVNIKQCDINNRAIFTNTKFHDIVDFHQSMFNIINFEKTQFEELCNFKEVQFNGHVNFKYTKFLQTAIFKDTIVKGELNLRDSIFKSNANFLGITSKQKHSQTSVIKDIKVANTETARIIKNFYINENNIIESNRFYKLELKAKAKETSILKEPFEYLVFKLHGLSSNHSQNYILALFWVFVFAFIHVTFDLGHGVLDMLVYTTFNYQEVLNSMANSINPFSLISVENLSFSTLIFKGTILYFIYQFIVSIRQNTRKK